MTVTVTDCEHCELSSVESTAHARLPLGRSTPSLHPLFHGRSKAHQSRQSVAPPRRPLRSAAPHSAHRRRARHMAVQALLRLSSRGEALIAELLRLSDNIPPLFSLAEKAEQKAFGEVLLDFTYLKTPALCEHKIESSAELVARDSEIWEVHGSIIHRVYDLFDSICVHRDFIKCVSDLRDGVYIQQTVEGVAGRRRQAAHVRGPLLVRRPPAPHGRQDRRRRRERS